MPGDSDVPTVAALRGREGLRDLLGRPLRDLRISVMDRCNFRCPYCMPRETFHDRYRFLRSSERLDFGEITRVARLSTRLGVRKVRITGGEPLLRPGIADLVAELSTLDGVEDIALTTNGVLLAQHAAELKGNGLHRVTVSLDSLDPAVFEKMSGGFGGLDRVLEGIEAALAAGLDPVKVNAVVKRGVNDHTVLALLERFRGTRVTVRLIEYMDVGNRNEWHAAEVVTSAELLDRIGARWPVTAVPGHAGARSRSVTVTMTAPGNWDSSRRSRHRSAGAAAAHAFRRRAPFSCACSRRTGSTCGHRCAPGQRTRNSSRWFAAPGRSGRTATARSATRSVPRRIRCARSRCTTSAGDEMFSHVDENDQPAMVDVSGKAVTKRTAVAEARVRFPASVADALREAGFATSKGPVFQTAIIAGVMAAKRTHELIPFCHPLGIENCRVEIDMPDGDEAVIRCTVTVHHRTGVEMEALTGRIDRRAHRLRHVQGTVARDRDRSTAPGRKARRSP